MADPARTLHPFPAQIDSLTGARLFMALGVVLFHYQIQWTLPADAAGLLNRARLGVDAFFMLSGFILAHVYLRHGTTPNYGRFLISRLARIGPLHVFMLAVMAAMVLGARLVGVGLEPGRFNLPDMITSLLLVHAWFPRQSLVLWNGPSWSLSAEWFAYLCFPAYAWIGLRMRAHPWRILALAALIFVAFDTIYGLASHSILPRAEDNAGVLRIIPEFLAGIGLYFLGERLAPSRRIAIGFAVVSTVLLLAAMQLPLDDRLIVLLAAPWLLSLALLSKAGVHTFLSHPAAQFAGQVSFALYLSHIPVLMVWRNAVEAVFGLPNAYLMGPAELAALLCVSSVVAVFLHLMVERPARDLITGRSAPSKQPGVETGRTGHQV